MFGWRKDDEDPFAALKDGGTYTSSTSVPNIGIGDPSVRPAPPARPAPPPRPAVNQASSTGSALGSMLRAGLPTVRRRSSIPGFPLGRILRWLVVIFVIVPIVISAVSAVVRVHHATSAPSIVTTTAVPAVPGAATAPPASYLEPGGLKAGLAHVARVAPHARVTFLRVDAHSLTAIVVVPGGAAKEIYFGPSTNAVLSARAGGHPIPISRIRPSAVARIERDLSARFHVPPRAISSMLLSTLGSLGTRWTVLTSARGQSTFVAPLSGAGLRRLGG